MGELLHLGALAATAVSTCCVAARGRRFTVRDFLLAVTMLIAMADVGLGIGAVAPIGWSAILIVFSLLAVTTMSGRPVPRSARTSRAMDAMAGVIMAALLIPMAPRGGAPLAGAGVHGGHIEMGVSAAPLTWTVVVAGVAFAAASLHMGMRMRPPGSGEGSEVRIRALTRAAPIAMAVSVLSMVGVLLA